MKKRMLILLAGLLIVMSGCEAQQAGEPEHTGKPAEEQSGEELQKNQEETGGEATGEDDGTEAGEKEITIYYIEEESEEFTKRTIVCEGDFASVIFGELKKESVLTEECQILSIKVNQEDKTIDLDVNEEFGNYLRGMGTAGEKDILKCTVKSILEAYGCKKMMITENGKPLETSHMILEDYISY